MKTLNSRITLTLFILVSSHLLAMAGDVSFKVTKKYLNFPVSHAEPTRAMKKDSARYTSRMKSQDRIVCIRKRIVRSSTLLPGEVGSMTLMD